MRFRFVLAGVAAGAVLGLLVFLASSPWKPESVLIGNPIVAALFGGLLGGIAACTAGAPSVTFRPSEKVIVVTGTDELERVLGSPAVVLVAFEAGWCGPSQTLQPTVHGLAEEYGERITVATVNVEDVLIPGRLQVTGIPDVRVFRQGREQCRFAGVHSRRRYAEALDRALQQETATAGQARKEDA